MELPGGITMALRRTWQRSDDGELRGAEGSSVVDGTVRRYRSELVTSKLWRDAGLRAVSSTRSGGVAGVTDARSGGVTN